MKIKTERDWEVPTKKDYGWERLYNSRYLCWVCVRRDNCDDTGCNYHRYGGRRRKDRNWKQFRLTQWKGHNASSL